MQLTIVGLDVINEISGEDQIIIYISRNISTSYNCDVEIYVLVATIVTSA